MTKKECPNCHNANKYGDYMGPTCEVCLGDGFVPADAFPFRPWGWSGPISQEEYEHLTQQITKMEG